MGGILGDNLGEGNCESKIASRQWGDNFLPRDINLSRRALWVGGALKERRRRRAEKRLSKRVFLESPFLLCPLKVFRTFQVF